LYIPKVIEKTKEAESHHSLGATLDPHIRELSTSKLEIHLGWVQVLCVGKTSIVLLEAKCKIREFLRN
jgi:hypothetical protein